MQAALIHTATLSVAMRPTHSALDESLATIERFLLQRFAERQCPADAQRGTSVALDIGFLGLSDDASGACESWQEHIVYPLRVHFSLVVLGPPYCPTWQSGPCPRCLEQRWLSNHSQAQKYSAYQHGHKILARAQQKIHLWALESLWDMLASETLPAAPAENGRAWFSTLSLDTLQVQRRQLIADSACPVCAPSSSPVSSTDALRLSTRQKRDVSHYRLVDPLAYPRLEKGSIDSLSGMLGNLVDTGLHHPVIASARGTYYLQGRDISWGANTTTSLISQRCGILEGLERYCGLLWPRRGASTITESYDNLLVDALDPATCGLYHPETYQRYAEQMEAFRPASKIDWVQGYSFRRGRPILVPAQLAYYGRQQKEKERFFVFDTSSGCAIGSCLEEAILHGLLELVERDTFLIHWYARLAAPRLDPWSSRNVRTLWILDRIERLGYDVFFLDTRLDLPFPTVTAVGMRRSDDLGKLSVAAGVGLDPEAALHSALCELASAIPGLSEHLKAREDALRPLLEDHTKVRSLHDHALLYGFPEMARSAAFLLDNPRVLSVEAAYEHWSAEQPRHHDLLADLHYCVQRIIELDLDVIVVDQTAPELAGTGLKVARVIVPGLVPIDFGWGRNRVFHLARMRTVPRTAGYQEMDFDLSLLNLIPHPFP